MNALFEMTGVDRRFYAQRLQGFLPARWFDVHAHIWLDRFRAQDSVATARAVTWPARVARDNSIEDLLESYRLLFPGRQVTPLLFGYALTRQDDIEAGNAYVSAAAARHGFPALLFALPTWSGAELEDKLLAGGFVGVKVYLTLAEPYLPEREIRIFDFLPPHQLEVLNRRGGMVMLHIPRDGRLRDPVNLAQMLEIEHRYPNVQLLIAHVGRAYCPEDIGDAFETIAQTRTMLFEVTANTNAEVFRRLLETVGPRRVLIGSDLPITRMRMRRVCEGGNYVNLVPKGLYGDVSGDRHMREVEGAEAERLSFFMYEVLDAVRRAAHAVGLTAADIEDLFYHNAIRLVEAARPRPVVQQLRMIWPPDAVPPSADRLPEGYRLRVYRAGDEDGYVRVMQAAGFATWTRATADETLKRCLPNGLFFIEHVPSGTLVATACASHNPLEQHPFGGELGWVAADPAHTGKGLGAIVCAAVVRRFREAGYRQIYLRTDDFRLPAIKTYLKMGWTPFPFLPDMPARWQAVMAALQREAKEREA